MSYVTNQEEWVYFLSIEVLWFSSSEDFRQKLQHFLHKVLTDVIFCEDWSAESSESLCRLTTIPESDSSGGWGIPAGELLWGLWRRRSGLQRTQQEWGTWTDLWAGGCSAPTGRAVWPRPPGRFETSCWSSEFSPSSASRRPNKTQERNLISEPKIIIQ